MAIFETSTTSSSLSPSLSLFLLCLLLLLLLLLILLLLFSLSLSLSLCCFLLSSYISSLSGLLNVYCQVVNIFLSFDFVLLYSNERSPMSATVEGLKLHFFFYSFHNKYLLSLLTFLLGLIKTDYEIIKCA